MGAFRTPVFVLAAAIGLLASSAVAQAQAPRAGSGAAAPARRLTTIDALRQFSGYFHLQSVLLRGEFVEQDSELVLQADSQRLRVQLDEGVRTTAGLVEVRGQVIDVGRLEPGDPRAAGFAVGRDRDRWPRPGEELFVRATDITRAEPSAVATVRSIALEPWKFEGQKVTILGNFRGRNLFGDLPGAPGTSRYDFVIRSADAAIWVTGLRPRGRGFELDVDRRVHSDRWIEVTGTVSHARGLVRVEGVQIALAGAPEIDEPPSEDALPPPPPLPAEVVFSAPTEGETGVERGTAVRVQFSRGLRAASVGGRIRVAYLGGDAPASPLAFTATYDAGTRAVEIRFAEPLEPFRTVRVEILEGLEAFDGGPVAPWTLTFSVGG